VVTACATTRERGNWITSDIIDAYSTLHEMGWAHSVETWNASGDLVGGLYGVHFDATFAGESMFHTATDASKVALITLTEWAIQNGVTLIDAQWNTEHLSRLGFVDMTREHYLARLAANSDMPDTPAG
jgi:leucyl/phenylalanyl-tRNA--protein transferase